MDEPITTVTGEQKQALQMVSDCGWGVKSADGLSLVEAPRREDEFREILDVVFGLPMDGSGTHLPSGQSVEDLGIAFESLDRGWYLVEIRPERPEGYGFDEDEGEMGSLESADQIAVRGPMTQTMAVRQFTELTGE